jgi:Protein of unknown function/AsmA-like C-terminal region
LKRRIAKFVGFGFLALFAVLALAAIALVWRVSQGPIAISFLNDKIEKSINAQLTGMQVKLGTAVLEIDPSDYVPHVRFRNLVLSDANGALIASAPRAAVTLDPSALLTGSIAVKNLELIGPKISARRNLDGTVELGVGGQDAPAEESIASPAAEQNGKSDRGAEPAQGATPQTTGAKLIAILDDHSDTSPLAKLNDIKITNASLSVYDDANSATWFAPDADLTFRKMPYGFVVLAKADVTTAKDPWHTEFSATYRHDQKSFAVSATVDNVIPADVSDKIFALSQFAKLRIPFAGHIELEASDAGMVTQASAEFTAGQGRISLPDFVAQPIDIENGTFNVKYRPEDSSFDVVDSAVVVGGARADLSGNIAPLRASDGKLSAIKIQLKAHNVALNAAEKNRNIIVDRVEFLGQAGINDASLGIDDFVVMSGNTGVRMRGTVSGGEKSPAIHLAGRVRDISAEFLKTIWPPIIAPQSRKWINENVRTGRVSEGTFQINLNEGALAKADIDKHLPKGSVDLTFKLKDVTAHYFKNLPLFLDASGTGQQHDNDFQLDIDTAQTTLGAGQTVKLNNGSFIAKNILLEEVPGIFAFDISAPVETMLAFASQPDINLLKAGMNDFPNLKGIAHATVGLKFPLIDNVPKDRVEFSTDVKLTNVNVANVIPGVDLVEGNFKVDLLADAITIAGPAKLNGLTAQINWQKPRAGGQAKISLSANLDEATREKIGLKLTDYMSGPMPVQASIEKDDEGNANMAVSADLSNVKMKLAAISWKRDATPGTKATFNMRNTSEGRSIENFVLDGDGLHLRGSVRTSLKGKLQSVVMDQIKLDEDNVFSAQVVPGEGTVDLVLSGKNFDARPYIKTLVSPPPNDKSNAPTTAEGQDFTMRAHFDRVTANRGEILTDVNAVLRARASKIAEADIKGTFLSGQPMSISVVPLPTGREFRIATNDGGSVLRAANFYSKIAGGQLKFYALLGNEEGSPIHKGRLDLLNFDVRNEATLAELDQRGKPKKSGPRKEGINFEHLYLPFTSDDKFVRLGNVFLKGTDMCATADGVIRKADNALDVTGSVIPACGLSGIFNNVPLLGDILSGGDSNEGLFGVTYFVGGTFAKPEVKINPLSALAPGIFRRLFDFSPKKVPGRTLN